jgi:PmbA protein
VDEKQILDGALQVLKAKKAQGDAYLQLRRSLNLSVREGRLEGITRSEVRGLAIRAMLDGRLGFVHTSRLDADAVAAAASKACGLARFASPREDLDLAAPAGPGDGRDEGEALGILDPEIASRPLAEKQEWARTAEAAARSFDPKITRTDGASWEDSDEDIWFANTRGLLRHCRVGHIQVAVSIAAEAQGELSPGDRSFETTQGKNLPDPAVLGREAAERALRMLGGRPVPSGKYPVVFSPDAGFAPLIYLSTALSGDSLKRGTSWLSEPLSREPGLMLGSSLATVRDDGRLPGGPATLPFDGEGVDTATVALLEQGRVSGRLCDLASAKRLGIPSTGSAERQGYEGQPRIRPHNLYLEPGTDTPETIIASVERGLWIWGLSGWWVGLDPANSQFSSAAFGLWIEKGKPVRPAARISVAGSVQEIFQGIDAVGSDLIWDQTTKTPTYRIRELAVGGGS